jgi:predicted permease
MREEPKQSAAPDWKRIVRQRLRLPQLTAAREAEIVEELAQQLDEAYREALGRGVGAAEARAAATRHVPDWSALARELAQAETRHVTPLEQRAQEQVTLRRRSAAKWGIMFYDLISDLFYAVRQIRQRPGFALVVVATLALGIGANSAIFSLVDAVVLRPLPVPRPEALVGLAVSDTSHSEYPHGMSYRDYVDYRDLRDAFDGMLVYAPMQISMQHNGQSELAFAIAASGDYFEVLGAQALVGRTFTLREAGQPGSAQVAVLSEGYWRRRFGSDPAIAGRNVNLNGHPYTIIGVMPAAFTGLESIFIPEAWVPLAQQKQLMPGRATLLEDRSEHGLRAWARLRAGVTPAQAEAALAVRAQQLAREYPATNKGVVPHVFPSWEARFEAGTGRLLGPAVAILIAVVGVVLLIACANVANLMLARATAVQKEVAVRLALGASRGRLVRQFLAESLLLAFLGAAGAVALAAWAATTISSIRPIPGAPVGFVLHLDARVLTVTALVAVVTAVLFGLVPALRATRPAVVPALKGEEGGIRAAGGRWSLRNLLVVTQVALSIVLLVCAGLFLRSLHLGRSMDLGLRQDHALLAGMDLSLRGYDEARGRVYYRDLLARVRSLPEVNAAALASPPPLSFSADMTTVAIVGRQAAPEQENFGVLTSTVSPGYFAAMGTALLEGRGFTEEDDTTAPRVAIINQHMARTYWPGQSAVGKRIRINRQPEGVEVVGVAKDGKYRLYFEPPLDYLFLPHLQNYTGSAVLVVHSMADMAGLAAAVRREAAALDADVPLSAVRTMPEYLDARFSLPNLFSMLLTIFGLVGITLAAVGLYGVMAYAVSRRTREMGVRMALGAQPSQVLGMVLTQGMGLTLVGLAIGLVSALGAGRLMSGMLYGISAADPLTFAAIALVLLAVALWACWVPARRAARVDPLVALRYE